MAFCTLSEEAEVSDTLLSEVVERLAEANLVIRSGEEPRTSRLAIARAPERVRILDVLHPLRGSPEVHGGADVELAARCLHQLESELEHCASNATLRDVLQQGQAPA